MNELTEQPRRPSQRRRSRDQRVRRFKTDLIKVAPHLADRRFAPLVQSFARLTLLSLDAYEYLRQYGLVGENRELRSSVDSYSRITGQMLKMATALNLTPAAMGKLRNERPVDLAAALARHAEDAEVTEDAERSEQ